MRRGEFTINGVKSSELHAKIQNQPILQAPRRKANRHDLPWKNGSIFFDLDSYENTEMDLLISLKATSFEDAELKRRKFMDAFDAPGYLRFIYYADESKAYYVRQESMVFGKVGINGFNQNVSLTLTIRPFKLEAKPVPIVSVAKTMVATNPYQWASEPIFIFDGSGDTVLTVNGKNFTFKNITNALRVDSSIAQCYRLNNGVPENHNDKMFTIDYPVLKPGKNTISWTGNLTKVTLEPRWNTII